MYTAIDLAGVKYEASKELKLKNKNSNYFFRCPFCNGGVDLKAGGERAPHFAHKPKQSCGYFDYKGMSDWHRDWQREFSKKNREVSIIKSGVKHIADVLNNNGIVIEFQHSPILNEQKKRRDEFYDKIIWVVDASNFDISFKERHTGEFKEYLAKDAKVRSEYGSIKNSEQHFMNLISEFYSIGISGISEELNNLRSKLKSHFDTEAKMLSFPSKPKNVYERKMDVIWKYERRMWKESKTPVFLDFGEEKMGLLDGDLMTPLSKRDFLTKYRT